MQIMATLMLPAGLETLVRRLVDDARGRRLVVLLDGGSGSGKTTLATTLAAQLRPEVGPVQLISLDDVYPGWSGLAAAGRAVTGTILRPAAPGYRRWNWDTGTPADIATQGYGVGNYYLVTGEPDKAKAVFERIIAGPGWNAFGYIAAEADLARMK